jgi:hypothetical protein
VNDYFRRQGVATAATRELFDLVCNAAATAAAVPGMLKALQDKHAATEEDASDKVTRLCDTPLFNVIEKFAVANSSISD